VGEAAKRREKLRQQLLAETERWSAPPSAEEMAVIASIKALPVVQVERQPKHVLDYMRMKPKECHQNCISYVRLDPDKKSKMVIGWRFEDGMYLLHSVIERDGHLSCITPVDFDNEVEFDFIPDAAIEMTDGGDGHYHFVRDGIVLHYGLRENPHAIIAAMSKIKADLLSGKDPYAVMRDGELYFS